MEHGASQEHGDIKPTSNQASCQSDCVRAFCHVKAAMSVLHHISKDSMWQNKHKAATLQHVKQLLVEAGSEQRWQRVVDKAFRRKHFRPHADCVASMGLQSPRFSPNCLNTRRPLLPYSDGCSEAASVAPEPPDGATASMAACRKVFTNIFTSLMSLPANSSRSPISQISLTLSEPNPLMAATCSVCPMSPIKNRHD